MAYNKLKDEDIIKFIKSYKKKECLWNKRSDNYNNIMVKIKSYNELSKEFDMNGLDIKRLINSLRASFIREWEIVVSEKPEILPPYEPQFKWYNEMTFLVDILQINLKNHIVDNEHDYVEYLQEEEFYTVPNYPSADAMKYSKIGLDSTKTSTPTLSSSGSNLKPENVCFTKESCDDSTTNSIMFKDEVTSKSNDEIDQFCKSLATQMLKLPVRSMIQLQMEIQNLISNKRLKELAISNPDLF